jgi:hypothetical protein
MSCESVNIIKGEDRELFVRITEECSGNNYDLTGTTAVKGIFKAQSGLNVEITLLDSEIEIVTPEANGLLKLIINDTKTSLLKTGVSQTFEIEIHKGTDKRIIQIEKILNVITRI